MSFLSRFFDSKTKKKKEMLSDKIIFVGEQSLADQAIIREMLVDYVKDIIFFAGGKSLRDSIHNKKPDAVLVTADLHGNDGFDIAEDLHKIDPDHTIPIIIMNKESNEIDQNQIDIPAIDFYITKPFHKEKIISLLFDAFSN